MLNNGRLSPVHSVAEKCDCRRCLAVFCDSLTFLRQCMCTGLNTDGATSSAGKAPTRDKIATLSKVQNNTPCLKKTVPTYILLLVRQI